MNKLNCILLVDDDSITNFLNEDLIKQMDIAEHVHIAKNGLQAMSFINDNCHNGTRQCPELVLLDISMPVMDGFEFLEEFEKMNGIKKDINIVMLTSSENEKDIERSKQFNISGYIGKPLTETKLKEILA